MAFVPNPLDPPPTQQVGNLPGQLSGITRGNMGAFQYTPPTEHLVRGQMGLLQRENGQYLRQAKQNAMELANARGQANSDYAAGAATRAAIDAALPIAAQDSETLTRIGLTNASNAQNMAELDLQRQIASGQGGGNIVYDMTGEQEAQRAHELQMQRERLAFEGEQSGLGRGHDYSMGLMGTEADLFGQMMGFNNQRQLGMDQYGYDLGRMGQEFGYNSALARLGADLGLRSDFFNNQWGMQRDITGQLVGGRMNLYNNIISQGMQVPEYMANPEAFMGFAQFVSGFGFDSIFDGMFGGRG